MRDDTTGEQTDGPADGGAGASGPTPGELRRRLERRFGDRPLMVYLVLIAGAVALLLLLIIVWISATDDGDDEPPVCPGIQPDQGLEMIRAGEVERIDVVGDQDMPLTGPSIVRLELVDATCRQLPEGADNVDQLLLIVGAAEYYNRHADQQVSIHYREQNLPSALLVTSTPLPTETPAPTGTAAPRTATPTAIPPTATATSTPDRKSVV